MVIGNIFNGHSVCQKGLLPTGGNNTQPLPGGQWSSQQTRVTSPSPAQVLLRVGLFPGPPALGSLVALGCRGILWLDPSRLLRSARAGPPLRALLPLFLPEQTQHNH